MAIDIRQLRRDFAAEAERILNRAVAQNRDLTFEEEVVLSRLDRALDDLAAEHRKRRN